MDIVFSTSSDGHKICSSGKIMLHSKYNPLKEAERFVSAATSPFEPSYVVVTEPALSYCAEYLREKYHGAVIVCIRYLGNFEETDCLWDKVFYLHGKKSSEKSIPLSESLYDFMGEDGISSCLFLSWKPGDAAFPSESSFCWSEIKKAVLKSRDVLSTRTFFSKRWTKNALRFSMFLKNAAEIASGKSDVLVCASGPSLESSFEMIKKNRDKFYLVAVSSALSPLINNGIIPDLCISTDGGYWAKLHLACNFEKYGIPLALPGEGACFGEVFSKTQVVPLCYGDGISRDVMLKSGIPCMKALRNGSVSGTALQFALSITSGDVYMLGLDLCFAKGFTHSRPNELEKRNSISDSRTCNLETRILNSSFASSSIDVYYSWFSCQDFGKRVYRLSNGYDYERHLDGIMDVDWSFFIKKNEKSSREKPELCMIEGKRDENHVLELLKKTVAENCHRTEWICDAFPADAISARRSGGVKDDVLQKMDSFAVDIIKSVSREDD